MTLAVLGGAILLLLLLIARLRLNAFLALLITSFVVGFANGMLPDAVLRSVLKGIGDTAGSLLLILVFGAILGKFIEESGAAHSIAYALIDLFGKRRIQYAVLATGFVVGLPMIYNASFLVLIPLIYTLSATADLPLLYLGIPLSSALSVTHGYLPPHPAPAAIAGMYHADLNRTLLCGLVLCVPGALLAGPVLSRCFRKLDNQPPAALFKAPQFTRAQLPGLGVSLGTVLIPIAAMFAGAVFGMLGMGGGWIKWLSDPNVALFAAVLVAIWTLGLRRGQSMDQVMQTAGAGVASVSMVMLIIASGGAFKQVLLDAGTGEAIKAFAGQLHWSPIVLAWSVAALLRLALGSATVAAITAGGILLPLVPDCGVAPELMVLATTSGSLMFSHFNDIGFWMFKEYYNATLKQTFQIWTVMESIVAVVGLGGALLLNLVLAAPAQKRVVYLNSYHEGYPSSDEAMRAIQQKLGAAGVHVRTAFLDAKRRGDPEELARRGATLAAEIRAFGPDLLIASDDDAIRYVVVPYFRESTLPVVFCGVNWSAEKYALPRSHITGMLEVVPIEDTLRDIPGARRLTVLSEDSTSEAASKAILDARYRALGLTPSYALVKDFDAWKREFVRAQQDADVVYVATNGAIQGWDKQAAIDWVREHIRKPVVTCDDFMMPYAVYGLTKIAREQGEWAADAALRILRGESPANIPVVANRQTACHFNSDLAARIAFQPPQRSGCR